MRKLFVLLLAVVLALIVGTVGATLLAASAAAYWLWAQR